MYWGRMCWVCWWCYTTLQLHKGFTVHTKIQTFPAPQCPSPLCLFLNPCFCIWWHRYPPCCCLVTLIDAINQTPWFAAADRGHKMKAGSAHTWRSPVAMLVLRAGSDTLWMQLGLYSLEISHLLSHEDVLGWSLEDKLQNSANCTSAIVLQESLRVAIAVANPGHGCWVSHLSAGFILWDRERAEGDPPCSERADLTVLCWSLAGHSWCPPAPWMVPAGVAPPAAVIAHQCEICAAWEHNQLLPHLPRAGELSWWAEGREWCALLYMPCSSHSSCAPLPSRGAGSGTHLQLLPVQFGNCSLDVS